MAQSFNLGELGQYLTVDVAGNNITFAANSLSVGNSTVNAVVNSTSIYMNGALVINSTTSTLTTNNASYLGGIAAASYALLSGASFTGTVNATAHTIGTTWVANASGVYMSMPLTANGGTGTAGQLLYSNGAIGAPYWAAAPANYTISTGLINTTGTITVNAAYIATISANNASYLGGTAAASYQLNSTLAANVAILTANNANNLGGTAASSYQLNSTLAANVAILTANNANNLGGVAASGYQTTAGLSANVATLSSNNSSYLGGTAAASYALLAGPTFTGTVTTANINSTGAVNAASHTIGTTWVANASGVYITQPLTANGGSGTAGQFLTSNGATGSPYWSTVVAGAGVNTAAAYTWTNTQTFSNTITFNSTINGTANNALYLGGVAAAGYQTTSGLAANVATLTANAATYLNGKTEGNLNVNSATTALTANNANNLGGTAASGYQTTAGLSSNVALLAANNASYLGTAAAASYQGTANLAAAVALLPANNASYLGGVAAASYVNTSGAYTISGVHTHSANLVMSTTAGVIANGGIGTAGQVLTSNGTTVYWSTVSGGGGSVNTAAAYTWTNTHTFSNPVVINGNLTVGTSSAIRRAVFANGEINFVPYTSAESSSANTQYYMNICDSAGNNGNLMTLNIRGLASNGSANASLTLVTVTANTFGVTGDVVSAYSDIRLKDVSGPITNALEKVSSLTGFNYTPNDLAISIGVENSKLNRVGVSAQDLQLVLPEAVKDAPGANGYLTVQYERVVPLLIEAIKELKNEIDELKRGSK